MCMYSTAWTCGISLNQFAALTFQKQAFWYGLYQTHSIYDRNPLTTKSGRSVHDWSVTLTTSGFYKHSNLDWSLKRVGLVCKKKDQQPGPISANNRPEALTTIGRKQKATRVCPISLWKPHKFCLFTSLMFKKKKMVFGRKVDVLRPLHGFLVALVVLPIFSGSESLNSGYAHWICASFVSLETNCFNETVEIIKKYIFLF